MKHLTEDQIFSLVDGGVPPNQEDSLRSHLSACAECRASLDEVQDLVTHLAPDAAVNEDAHLRQVMAAVEARLSNERRRANAGGPRGARGRAWIAGATTLVALAAGVLFFVGNRHPEPVDRDFAARGAARESTLSRNVGVRLFFGEHRAVPLENGAVVTPDAAFTAAYTNLHPKPVYLLLFAVDSANAVHWLYPAYSRANEDPASVVLGRANSERLLPTSVVLDAPAPGLLRILSIASESPLHVSDIEKRSPAALEREPLERDFRAATIMELRLAVSSVP